jgi:hypothetical protein
MVAFHQDVCILYTLDAKNGSSVTVDGEASGTGVAHDDLSISLARTWKRVGLMGSGSWRNALREGVHFYTPSLLHCILSCWNDSAVGCCFLGRVAHEVHFLLFTFSLEVSLKCTTNFLHDGYGLGFRLLKLKNTIFPRSSVVRCDLVWIRIINRQFHQKLIEFYYSLWFKKLLIPQWTSQEYIQREMLDSTVTS